MKLADFWDGFPQDDLSRFMNPHVCSLNLHFCWLHHAKSRFLLVKSPFLWFLSSLFLGEIHAKSPQSSIIASRSDVGLGSSQ